MPNTTLNFKLKALKKNALVLKYIDNPTEEMNWVALKKSGGAIEYIDNPTEEMQLTVFNHRGYYLRYIKNPTKKVQLEAVRQTGEALKYIDNPTEEMQLNAVRKESRTLSYIKNPTEKVIAASKGTREAELYKRKRDDEELARFAKKISAPTGPCASKHMNMSTFERCKAVSKGAGEGSGAAMFDFGRVSVSQESAFTQCKDSLRTSNYSRTKFERVFMNACLGVVGFRLN